MLDLEKASKLLRNLKIPAPSCPGAGCVEFLVILVVPVSPGHDECDGLPAVLIVTQFGYQLGRRFPCREDEGRVILGCSEGHIVKALPFSRLTATDNVSCSGLNAPANECSHDLFLSIGWRTQRNSFVSVAADQIGSIAKVLYSSSKSLSTPSTIEGYFVERCLQTTGLGLSQ